MQLCDLLPHLAGLHLDRVEVEEHALTLTVSARQRTARCPCCATRSSHIQSRYTRTVADLPLAGRRLVLRLRVRRFRCRKPRCDQAIFAERFPALVPVYGRRTHAQRALVQDLGCAVGGTAGARLAQTLRLPVSRATVLRLVRARPLPPSSTPRVLGVDDWSQRRGRSYGTILVDLERRRPLALLPDRSADTLAAWLQAHPGVEVISRDRAEAYAEGARRGAPDAVQVADRFHLVKNLGDALVQVLTHHRRALDQIVLPTIQQGVAVSPTPRADPRLRTRRQARYEQVVTLRAQGWTHAAIAHAVGVSPRTIVRWLAARSFPERKPRWRPPSPLEPFAAYLTQRWEEGCHNAMQLWREVCARGYRGPRYRIWEVARRLRQGETAVHDASVDAPPAVPRAHRLRPGHIAAIIMRRVADRAADQQQLVAAVAAACPEVQRAFEVCERFLRLLRERRSDDLAAWMAEATACGLTDLERFAIGLERDLAAVRAALELEYSNGQTEGQITRLKLLKRSMYGRAKLDLLERRVLYRELS